MEGEWEESESGFLGIEGVGVHTGQGFSFSKKREKWPVLSSPVSFIQLSYAKLNKAVNCPAQNKDHHISLHVFNNDSWPFSGLVKGELSLSAAPHTILIL